MRAIILSLALLVISSSVAQAQDKKAAEKSFNEAQKHFGAGQYKEAVQGFLTAYQMVPVNPLLFNIGQAYRLSGEPDKALSYYEKYVAFEPNGAQVAEARDHIQKLKEQIETARRDQERVAAEKQAREQAEQQARAGEEQRKQAELVAQRKRDAEKAGSGLRTGGMVVGGIGVVALGAGIGLGAGDKFDGKSIALIGVGAAAVAAGTVMFFMGKKQRSDAIEAASRTALIVPQITGDSFGVAWVTTF